MKYKRMLCWVRPHEKRMLKEAVNELFPLVFAKNYDDFRSQIKNVKNKKIYGLSFNGSYGMGWHCGRLSIHDNLDAIHNDICVNVDTLDEIKEKYENNQKFYKTADIEIDEHYYKGIFYKEDIYDILGKNPYKVNVVGFVGNYIKIEFADLFVHYKGCLLLDIENKKIIETKKYD